MRVLIQYTVTLACLLGLTACITVNQPNTVESPAFSRANETRLLVDRLEAGTRTLCFILLQDTRGTRFHDSFVGSITKLKEDQDFTPTRLYVQYKIRPFFGIGASYDKFGAEAWDDGGTDGTAVLSGPLFYVLGCYPNSTALTPFCELGTAFYSTHFDHSSTWGTQGNKRILLDNTSGYYVSLGCDMQVRKHLEVNIYGRYMNVDDVGVFMLNEKRRDDVILTVSHLALGLGMNYCF